MSDDLHVGVARVEYTPEPGLPLMGNFRDDYTARGVHDGLFGHAVVVRGGDGTMAGVLTVDVCMIDEEMVSEIRQYVSSKCDLPGENLVVAATHTHAGPTVVDWTGFPRCEPEVSRTLMCKAADAVVQACASMQPGSLVCGKASEDRVSFVRRLRCKDGQTHMNWEGLDPDFVEEVLGPVDPELVAVGIHQNGSESGALVNFALHPAVLAGDNWLYSADYPGYLAETLRRLRGEHFISMFANGCCGNVNHIDYSDPLQGRGYQMTQRIGYMLGVAANEALNTAVAVNGDQVAVTRQTVAITPVPISEEDKVRSEKIVKEAADNPAAGQVDGLPEEMNALRRLELYKAQFESHNVEVMAVRIGDVAIVTFPGEVFSEFGLQIKQASPARHTLVIELANGSNGYFPTAEAISLGGYEPTLGTRRFTEDAGDLLAGAAIESLKKLF